MDKLKLIKITLLIIILAEEIKSVREKTKKSNNEELIKLGDF
ncbi:hypothetical protein V5G65_03490 [Mammaliicoccus sciuri]